MKSDTINRILGGSESHLVLGNAPYDIPSGLRGFALTVRITGTIILVLQVQDENGAARAYTPTWRNISLIAGDYFVIPSPLTRIQLNGATDSVIIHCDKPY